MRTGYSRKGCAFSVDLCAERSKHDFFILVENKGKIFAVLGEEVLFGDERDIAYFNLYVFVFIRFVNAQTEHDFSVSAAAYLVFPEADTGLFIFVFKHVPQLIKHFFGNGNIKHILSLH